MTDLPAAPSASPPSSPERAAYEAWLRSPERQAHRGWIGGRIVTLLGHYWREDDPTELTAALAKDWADLLEGYPRAAIEDACKSYLRDQPRRKPTPGDICNRAAAFQAIARRRRPKLRPEPEPPACSAEAARDILARAGFTPKRMRALRRAPMARSVDEAEAIATRPAAPHWTERADPEGPEMAGLAAARDGNEMIRQAREAQARIAAGTPLEEAP